MSACTYPMFNGIYVEGSCVVPTTRMDRRRKNVGVKTCHQSPSTSSWTHNAYSSAVDTPGEKVQRLERPSNCPVVVILFTDCISVMCLCVLHAVVYCVCSL